MTQPCRNSQARISIYATLWSLLGINVEYALGVDESKFKILGKPGNVGNDLAKLEELDASLLISAFGDTMYVSR